MTKAPWHLRRTERECAQCGASFMPAREASITCSEPCRLAHKREREQRNATRPHLKPLCCRECNTEFQPLRSDQVFCSKACRFEDHNRELSRAKVLYRELYHWKLSSTAERRGSFLTVISQALGTWVSEDKRHGRPPPPVPELSAPDRQRKDWGAGKGRIANAA